MIGNPDFSVPLEAFKKHARPLSIGEDDAARIEHFMDRAAESLFEADGAVSREHELAGINNVEDVVLNCAWAAATSLGYKYSESHKIKDYHMVVLEFLRLYVNACRPDLSKYASRFQAIRQARNNIKYPDNNIEVPFSQVKQNLVVADAFFTQFAPEPMKRWNTIGWKVTDHEERAKLSL